MDTIEAWKCIGCGNIEAPQTCIGVCQYRKVQLVDALEHERILADLRNAQQSRQRVRNELLRRLAYATPRDGEWERSLSCFAERGKTRTERRRRCVTRTARSACGTFRGSGVTPRGSSPDVDLSIIGAAGNLRHSPKWKCPRFDKGKRRWIRQHMAFKRQPMGPEEMMHAGCISSAPVAERL
jgi:hypothetical protein